MLREIWDMITERSTGLPGQGRPGAVARAVRAMRAAPAGPVRRERGRRLGGIVGPGWAARLARKGGEAADAGRGRGPRGKSEPRQNATDRAAEDMRGRAGTATARVGWMPSGIVVAYAARHMANGMRDWVPSHT